MTDLSQLIERIEKSEGADRELDARIQCWLHGVRYKDHFSSYRDRGTQIEFTRPPKRSREVSREGHPPSPLVPHAPAYTASIDAVRLLIDPADEWELTTLYGVARAAVGLNRDHQTAWPGYGEHQGGDPVRALLSAALKARNPSHEG